MKKEWWNNFLFLRFLGIGTIATIAHYSSYVFLLQVMKINPVISNLIGFLISFVLNFILTHTITFRVSFSLKRFFSFSMTHLSGFLLNQILFYLFSLIGVAYLITPLFVFPIVTVSNFLMIRYFFKKK